MSANAQELPSLGRSVAKQRQMQSYGRLVLQQLVRNRAAMVGGIVLLLIALIVIIGPFFIHQDQFAMNLRDRLLSPSLDHPLGTDLLGRDMLERLILGGRISMGITFGAVAIALVAGSAIGVAAGYFGGKADFLLMRAIDVLMTLPGFLLAIAIVAALGVGTLNVMLAVGVAAVPAFARISRGSTLSIRNQEYVEAAHALGSGTPRIMLRHVIPNILPPLIVQTTLQLAHVMLTASGLSFLGLGPQPPSPEWGAMLAEGRDYIINAPLLVVFPGITILIVSMSFNLLGDGLRDAVDPYLRR
jgi:peptide/nickel transport system permease protein